MSIRRPEGAPLSAGASVLLGMWLLGRGRALGLICFRDGSQALLSAFAPTLAVALIGSGLAFTLPHAQVAGGVTRALVPVVCTLLQLVVSALYAQRLGKAHLWTRYATASLWCDWLPLALMIVAQGVFHAMLPSQAGSAGSLAGMSVGVELYSLWLSWFVARVGLHVGRWVAVFVVALQVLATTILLAVLWLLPPHYNAVADMLGGAL